MEYSHRIDRPHNGRPGAPAHLDRWREGGIGNLTNRRTKGPFRFDAPTTANWPVIVPSTAVLLVSILIRCFDLDLAVARSFFDPANSYFPLARAEPWLGFYRYGIYLPLALGFLSVAAIVLGRWAPLPIGAESQSRVRREGLFLVLMLLIGPGLLVNSGLKSLWGRPRPWQCEQFGGPMGFQPVGEIASQKFPNSSFPSGHAAVAFFLIGPAFFVRNRHVRQRWVIGGMGYGIAMGFTRILQGGHFVSDVIWAGLIVYLVGVGLAHFFFRDDDQEAALVSQQEMISVAPTSNSSIG